MIGGRWSVTKMVGVVGGVGGKLDRCRCGRE